MSHRAADLAVGSTMADFGSITTRASNPWKTLEQVVEYGKRIPASSATDRPASERSSFAMEIFKMSYGLDIAHVPFQGTGQSRMRFSADMCSWPPSSFSSLGPLIKSGDPTALVSTAPKRLAEFPNVPTMAEGFPEATLNLWMLLAAPAKTPPDASTDCLRRSENHERPDGCCRSGGRRNEHGTTGQKKREK